MPFVVLARRQRSFPPLASTADSVLHTPLTRQQFATSFSYPRVCDEAAISSEIVSVATVEPPASHFASSDRCDSLCNGHRGYCSSGLVLRTVDSEEPSASRSSAGVRPQFKVQSLSLSRVGKVLHRCTTVEPTCLATRDAGRMLHEAIEKGIRQTEGEREGLSSKRTTSRKSERVSGEITPYSGSKTSG